MNIQRFCHPDYPDGVPRLASELLKPFVYHGWKYASDARIAVRVPTDEPDTPGLSKYVIERIPGGFDALDWSAARGWKILPKTTDARVRGYDWCESCQDICNCQADDDSPEGCRHCIGGYTYRKDCPECKGTGKVFYERHYYYRFGGIAVHGKYLAMLWEEMVAPAYTAPVPGEPLQVSTSGYIDEAQALVAQLKIRSTEPHVVIVYDDTEERTKR